MSKYTFLVCLFIAISAVSASYDTTEAKTYASASALAYCDPKAINAWTCGEPCKNLTGYQPYFSEVFNVAPGETLSFSMIFNPSTKKFLSIFRGTAGTEQLLLEILEGNAVTYDLSKIPNALADAYFYTHYVKTLKPVFNPLIKNAYSEHSDYQFVFTGHSLGGALTTLAAFDVISEGIIPKSKVIMYNYGSPRLGNQVLAQAIDAAIPEIYRVVHWQDMVPHVPPCAQSSVGGDCEPTLDYLDNPSGILWPAWHVQSQIFYNEANTDYQVCTAEEPTCMDQFSLAQTNTNDHSYYAGVKMGCSGTSAIGFGPDVPKDAYLIV